MKKRFASGRQGHRLIKAPKISVRGRYLHPDLELSSDPILAVNQIRIIKSLSGPRFRKLRQSQLETLFTDLPDETKWWLNEKYGIAPSGYDTNGEASVMPKKKRAVLGLRSTHFRGGGMRRSNDYMNDHETEIKRTLDKIEKRIAYFRAELARRKELRKEFHRSNREITKDQELTRSVIRKYGLESETYYPKS